jgi:protein ImuB
VFEKGAVVACSAAARAGCAPAHAPPRCPGALPAADVVDADAVRDHRAFAP